MRRADGSLVFSASDLAKHLGCRHLTQLDRRVAEGKLDAPHWTDPALEILQQRGFRHEDAYLEQLKGEGQSVVTLRDFDDYEGAFDRTVAAMRTGADVIVQADLRDGAWMGRADVLIRVDTPSKLGPFSYEVLDTKLSQETRGGTILQLCLYTDLVSAVQGVVPELMHVVKPGADFPQESFRFADFHAYYRFVRRRLESSVQSRDGGADEHYPLPVPQCEVCRWWKRCDDRRRADDHLSFVAGMGRGHIAEVERHGTATMEDWASAEVALPTRPQHGSLDTFDRLHAQARIQVEGRNENRLLYELLPFEEGHGFARLPEPSSGDVFFDIEADPFVDDGGIEYLLGYAWLEADGTTQYRPHWAFDRASEKRSFEQFIDFVMARWAEDSDMSIYHFTSYETGAIKRLAGRHGTREIEVDALLRGRRFVDLHPVAKQGLRASVEQYSLKALEAFFDFERVVPLPEAKAGLRRVAWALELNTPDEITDADREAVQAYNKDDCLATLALRDWLEERRAELQSIGVEILRPERGGGEAPDGVLERSEEVEAIYRALTDDLPEDRESWDDLERARWLLANQLEYFRREDKIAWWEFFRLHDLEYDDLIEERKAIAGLEFVDVVGQTARGIPIERYRYPDQEVAIKEGGTLHEVGGDELGRAESIDAAARTIDIRKMRKTAEVRPTSVMMEERVSPQPIDGSLLAFATSVAEGGVDGTGPFRAGRDLLLARRPRRPGGDPRSDDAGGALRRTNEDTVAAATRLLRELERGVLPIQGPPGTGKTYAGARMIVDCVRAGQRVGVTAVSHKVIRNLLDEAISAADEAGVPIDVVHKHSTSEEEPERVTEEPSPATALERLGPGVVLGGTAWLWSRDDAVEAVDTLFVDEAGQMALAPVLAASRAAKNLVLLGDPQQLEQPQRGAHPEGAEVAALVHILGGRKTIPDDRGLFLDQTYRLSPPICAFTSELYYEGRLQPQSENERQKIVGPTPFAGAGLFHVPVEHEGHQSSAPEEVEAVARIVEQLCRDGVNWIDRENVERALTPDGVLVIAPYNAQVGALRERMPHLRIGTVDKFQGQQAPVVIYSMTSSSADDAPRGMGFLYNPNRLNVATSRARCVSILVATPRLLEPECRSPEQLRWANGLCRYAELAEGIELEADQ